MAKLTRWELYQFGYLTGSGGGSGSARSRRQNYGSDYELPF